MAQNNTVKIAAICGSLRKASTNMMLLKIAQEVAPSNAVFEFIDYHDVPMYNEDLEENVPQCIIRVKKAIASCDAILFGVAEYNFSVSSPLKTVVDWASRPNFGGGNVFKGRPAAMISAAGGRPGGHRAQLALRDVCHFLDTPLINQPMVCVGSNYKAFTEGGKLKDDKQTEAVKEIVQKLVDFTLALREYKATH